MRIMGVKYVGRERYWAVAQGWLARTSSSYRCAGATVTSVHSLAPASDQFVCDYTR